MGMGYNAIMKKKEPKTINGIKLWQCCTCKQWLPESEYYKDKRTPNGLKVQCKSCHTSTTIKTRNPENARRINREYMRRSRKTNPEKYQRRERLYSRNQPWSIKKQARYLLNLAIRRKEIIRPAVCSKCGEIKRITAHHEDYKKSLAVRWLCYECHGNQ